MKKSKTFLLCFFLCFACTVSFPNLSSANPEYAKSTGKKCAQCHEKAVVDRGRAVVQGPSFKLPLGDGTYFILIASILCSGAILYSYRRRTQAQFPL